MSGGRPSAAEQPHSGLHLVLHPLTAWRAAAAGGVDGPALILVGNALIGLVLAAASGGVLLSKMRPPLEDELLKRSAAVCRAAAAELQYAVMVADRGMAGRGLERLAREPAVRVAGAWLVEAESGLLASWRREVEAGPPAHWWFAAQGRTTRRMLEADGHPYALVGCPVEAMKDAGSAPAALLRPGGGAGDAGLLWLLVDAEEVSGTVRRGFLGALGIVSLAIFLAVGLQLAIALFVIARLSESMRQLRETRGRLVKADKLAALGTLSAGVAHEINNPLSYVVANLEYLARGLGGPKPPGPDEVVDFREALAEARQGAERVRVIVRDLKALARGDEDKVAPLDVRRVAESSINIAMNEIKHRARLVRDFDEVAPVDANDVRLGQVFLNLLLNAVHAIPEGRIDANQIRVATRPWPDGRVAVEVRDTGAGIAAENLPRLFDPFFTTKPVGQGTGLGLWVCHGIVTSLGGEIFVESEVGKGTAVRVLLPPSKGASATDASPSPAEESRGRILVVDDEILVGRSIERLLGLQHDVVAVARASEALRRIDEGERFDAILCDVMIPEMTGIELLEELRRRHPELAERVVFITGSAFTPGTAERLQRIPNVRLDKPFDRARLQAALGAILRRRVEPPPLDQAADRPRLVAAG